MSAKKSSKSIKGKRKGGSAPRKGVNKPVASKPKVVVQKATPSTSPPPKKTTRSPKVESAAATMPFTRQNYILLAIGVGIIILGFFLMSLDNFIDATQFSISLYIAPIVVIAGFAEIVYAIMYRPKSSPQTQETGQ